jgi:predicted nucleic acid-binding protein
LSAGIIESVMAYLFHKAEFVVPQERIRVVQADPSDNIFLEAAVAGGADWIVSGDKAHLLPIGEFRRIPIVSPRKFMEWLQGQAAH